MPSSKGINKRRKALTQYDVLPAEADEAHGDMPMSRKKGNLAPGLGELEVGIDKETRNIKVPDRLFALITAASAESMGTYFLILAVGLTIASIGFPLGGSRIANGVTYGAVFAFLHSIFSKYSGGHFNPSTTLAIFLGYQFSKNLKGEYFKNGWGKLLWGSIYLAMYTIVQVVFAFIAGWTTEWVLKGDGTGLGVPVIPGGGLTSDGRAFFIEYVFTLVITLGYFILMMERTKGHLDSLFLGIAYCGFYLAAAPITGGAFNPVRFMGPAIANLPGFSWADSWIYIVGPYLGAISAWIIYEIIRVILIPSRQYIGWVPLITGPRNKTIYAHFVTDKKGNKNYIRM